MRRGSQPKVTVSCWGDRDCHRFICCARTSHRTRVVYTYARPPSPPIDSSRSAAAPPSTRRSRHWPIEHNIICAVGQFATPRQLCTLWTRAWRQERDTAVANCAICSSNLPAPSGERRLHRKPIKACGKCYSAGVATPRSRSFCLSQNPQGIQ
jgi:hypothetical protein